MISLDGTFRQQNRKAGKRITGMARLDYAVFDARGAFNYEFIGRVGMDPCIHRIVAPILRDRSLSNDDGSSGLAEATRKVAMGYYLDGRHLCYGQ